MSESSVQIKPGAMPIDWRKQFPRAFDGVRVCVTGGAGFIGSHLVDALVEAGADVLVVDDLSAGALTNLSRVGDRISFVRASILEPKEWLEALRGCRYMFHLAALGSVPRSIVEPEIYEAVNVRGTLQVLMAAHAANVGRVIFSGSSSAYGDAPGATVKVESMPPLPRSPYAASKLAGEHLMRAWACSYGLDTVVLRYFNIFGPRQNANSAYAAVIAAFAKAMRQGQSGTIYGDGLQTRDFTFVANAVFANMLAASREAKVEGEVMNIATGHAASVLELHRMMAAAFGLRDVAARHEPARKGDVAWSRANIERAGEMLGYRPLVSFEQGLDLTVRWYQNDGAEGSR